MKNAVIDVLIAAVLYYLAARIGLLFAIPPGFASAIWPAAGIGLAIVLTRSNISLLGIFLGSFLANLPLTNELSLDGAISIFPAAIIAAGSTLQMGVTKTLVNAFNLWPIERLQNLRIFLFLVITGPLCCLIAASVGTAVQATVTELSWEVLGFIWFTWWIGDSVGVMFFCPLVLILLRLGLDRKLSLDLGLVITSIIMFCLVSLVFDMSKRTHGEKVQTALADKTYQITSYITRQFELSESQVATLRSFYLSSEKVTRKEFKQFTDDFFSRNYLLRAIEWVPVVNSDNVNELLGEAFNSGLEDFFFKNIDGSKVNVDNLTQAIYPVFYVNPLEPNKPALGLNLASESMRSETISRAIQSDSVIASEPIDLVQDDEAFPGVLLLLKVNKGSSQHQKAEGVVISVIQINKMFDKIKSELDTSNLEIKVAQNDQVIYTTGEHESVGALSVTHTFMFFDKQWRIEVTPKLSFSMEVKDWQSWLVIVTGFLIAILAQGFLLVINGYQKELKLQVSQKTADLEKAKTEAERANNAKSQFLANMSHEIRTPLNAVMGYAQLGLEKQDADHRKSFQAILQSSNILLRLLGEVLDLAKIEAGRQVIDNSNFNLHQLVERVETSFRNSAQAKGLTLSCTIDESVPVWVNSDEVRIEQIINNLMSNAIKFTEQGYVKLTVINKKQQGEQVQLEIRVEDSGIGMSDDVKKKIFSAFIQADNSHSRKYGGTGLGLAITRKLCELMDGSIDVSSQPGRGSVFTVMLTVYQGIEEAGFSIDSSEQFFEGKRILIVEDVKLNQMLLKELLKLFKCEVFAVDDGLQAIQYLQNDASIDLVFMDVQMPIMDGFEATAKIRQELDLRMPIIALSADVIEKDKSYALDCGMNFFLTKPVKIDDLKKVLTRYLS